MRSSLKEGLDEISTFHFSRVFVEKCEEFVRNNPRVASSPQELIIRSGRMLLHMLLVIAKLAHELSLRFVKLVYQY